MPVKPSIEPVIYVHAKGRGQVRSDSARALLGLGLPVCNRLGCDGLTKTENGYDDPALLIAELAGLFPGRPIIFLRAGLQPTRSLIDGLTGLLAHVDQPAALTVLSNADARVNPFTGLRPPGGGLKCDPAGLVNLLAPGQWHGLDIWTDHFILVPAALVSALSNGSRGPMQSLHDAGASLLAPDQFFLHDADSKLFAPLKLQPHESAYPPPFSELSARLQQWCDAGITELPVKPGDDTPATLHVTHSWGGGVAQWLRSFIATDKNRRHFQLRSEGPQSGIGSGQKLALYAGNELRCPIASWWLTPPIASVSDDDRAYREILSEICRRYGIGRVFVSSLVGHSLEALRSGKPTLQILHDNFPLWPLLSVNPQPYLVAGGQPDLERALREHAKTAEFRDKDARDWAAIRAAYVRTITEHGVRIAAPGQAVLDLQTRLEPAFGNIPAKVIPHGFPALGKLQAVRPKPRADGRLRLLVLGRMQPGKGQQLLAESLAQLTRHVQVYLVGAGKSGEVFFGRKGVDVILDYERDELPAILAEIGPDFAALLSVVPETFSYTLSELQQMRIPVIATCVGSFPDRIEHGKTGWLIDPEPGSLVDMVARLCASPGKVETVRSNLPGAAANSLEAMLGAYDELCPTEEAMRPYTPVSAGSHQVQQAAAEFQSTLTGLELRQSIERQAGLEEEVEKRTEWALETGKQLQLEQKRREEWVNRLDAEIARLQEIIVDHQAQLHELDTRHRELDSEHRRLKAEHTLVLGSTSWKITRPLRVARRAAKNFMLARAWNPARWPWLTVSGAPWKGCNTPAPARSLNRMWSATWSRPGTGGRPTLFHASSSRRSAS